MKYLGSKKRHAKDILKTILPSEPTVFVDLFTGGCNLLSEVPSSYTRIANDSNYYLIEMWKALIQGWQPPDIVTEEHYQELRYNIDEYPPHLVAYVGFCFSYSGKWFGGYARDNKNWTKEYNELVQSERAKRLMLQQACKLLGVNFTNLDYREVPIPANSIVYCDPPYKSTTQYDACKDFNHEEFYQYCRSLTANGHKVFISEYSQVPDDFTIIWQKSTSSKVSERKKIVENLYTLM